MQFAGRWLTGRDAWSCPAFAGPEQRKYDRSMTDDQNHQSSLMCSDAVDEHGLITALSFHLLHSASNAAMFGESMDTKHRRFDKRFPTVPSRQLTRASTCSQLARRGWSPWFAKLRWCSLWRAIPRLPAADSPVAHLKMELAGWLRTNHTAQLAARPAFLQEIVAQAFLHDSSSNTLNHWIGKTNCEISQHTKVFLLVAAFCRGKMVDLLNDHGIEFDTFDILSDEEVRQGLKDYSNWPTYPQLYAKGKLLGGLDIIKELAEEGSLTDELSAWDPHRSRAWASKRGAVRRSAWHGWTVKGTEWRCLVGRWLPHTW